MSAWSEEFWQIVSNQGVRPKLQPREEVILVRDAWARRFRNEDFLSNLIITAELPRLYEKAYFGNRLAVDPFEGKLPGYENGPSLGGVYLSELNITGPTGQVAEIIVYERIGAALLPRRGYHIPDAEMVIEALREIRIAAQLVSYSLCPNLTISGSCVPAQVSGPS